MSRNVVARTLVVLMLASVVAGTVARADHDESTIEVENKSQSDGEIVFKFTPVGGEPQEIKVGVIAKTQPSEIAKDIMKSFSLALGDDYKIKMKGDKAVSIEGNSKVKDREIKFSIAIAGVNVAGLSVVIK
jgi:hypothetical protein